MFIYDDTYIQEIPTSNYLGFEFVFLSRLRTYLIKYLGNKDMILLFLGKTRGLKRIGPLPSITYITQTTTSKVIESTLIMS